MTPSATRRLVVLSALIAVAVSVSALFSKVEAQPQAGPPTAAASPATAAAPGPLSHIPVLRQTLDNGLRVVMSPDHTMPIVAIAIYYDVGSRNEVQGRSGFAHLFEHMMFEGSANVGKGEHFQLVMNRGGDMNGTTNADRTNYYETLPSNELALGLWLEADRMRSLSITTENFENQRATVMEERRQSYDNRAYMPSMLRINELAYADYWPYAHSTIGHMRDLQNAPLEAVQEFFDQYYAPNNAVLAIAGDFEREPTMALVRRHFGSIGRRDVPAYEPPAVRPQTSEQTDVIIDQNAQLPAFHVAYRIPPSREADHYPLELLAMVLGEGESSRLYQQLVKRAEICQQIDVATDGRRGPDLFSVWAIVASGHTAGEARAVIYQEIADVAQNGVTERELQMVKNRVRSQFIFGLQSNRARAMHLATYEMFWGDARLLLTELENYDRVTVADVRRVASQYFDGTNRTVLDVQPAPPTQAVQEGGQP